MGSCSWLSVRIARAAVCVLAICPTAAAEPPRETTDSGLSSETCTQAPEPVSFARPVLLGAIRVYQRFVSPFRAGYCPMDPSCSAFAYEAFSLHSPVRAYLMAADRLHRCSHDLSRYKRSARDPALFSDPVPRPAPRDAPKLIAAFSDSTDSTLQEPAAAATTSLESRPDKRLLRFADELRSRGSFREAALEYQRFLSYYAQSPDRQAAAQALFETYRQNGEYLKAVRWGETLLENPSLLGGQPDDFKLTMGYDLMGLGNGPRARAYFAEVSASQDVGASAKASLLEGLSFAKDGLWADAAAAFEGVKAPPDMAGRAAHLAGLAAGGARLPLKKPALAGALSIIPGLGYLYDGYAQTALASLIVNGLFMAATYKAFADGNEPLGVVLGFFTLGWYGGNIFGSVSTAHRRNAAMKEEHILKFEVGFSY